MAGLIELMDRLLAPDGCPWDREQTLTTLRPYLLEEAHEVLEAMDDPVEHRLELGDLLFQIVFQSALRQREGAFGFDDVVDAIRDKMVRRHPHVFARNDNSPPVDADAVARNWSRIKAEERRDAGPGIENPIAGVPRGLPALQRAWRLQEKAAAVGFDWPQIEGVANKVDEEWAELRAAVDSDDRAHMHEELGDLLFVVVRLAQKLGLEPEDALRDANKKFERRFTAMIHRCERAGTNVRDADLDTLEAHWEQVKRSEREP
ncbi:MAG: nucleoside triphosphate pyrophosphohydrolase [Myxococcales bacterium FL481]|nr:MAG: nucleoside triphosphate pyrophosphohydrolase [Myxococcales bacterium FL481]